MERAKIDLIGFQAEIKPKNRGGVFMVAAQGVHADFLQEEIGPIKQETEKAAERIEAILNTGTGGNEQGEKKTLIDFIACSSTMKIEKRKMDFQILANARDMIITPDEMELIKQEVEKFAEKVKAILNREDE